MVKVLLIEEDAETRALATRALTAPAMTVMSADNYLSAFEMLRTQGPEVVVIGVNIPDLRGYDLCQEILRDPDLQHIGVVLCSAQSYPADIRRAKELGADEYVTK